MRFAQLIISILQENTSVYISIVLLKIIYFPYVHRCYIRNHTQSSLFYEKWKFSAIPWFNYLYIYLSLVDLLLEISDFSTWLCFTWRCIRICYMTGFFSIKITFPQTRPGRGNIAKIISNLYANSVSADVRIVNA